MKHLKLFEYYTTSSHDDVEFNYGDKKPEISQFVLDTVDYIKHEMETINSISIDKTKSNIDFNWGNNIQNIILHKETGFETYYTLEVRIKKDDPDGNLVHRKKTHDKTVEITEEDYNYTLDFFKSVRKKWRIKVDSKDKEDINKSYLKNTIDKFNI